MGWYVLLPPLVAIGLALWTRQVYLSLFAGLLLGATLLAGGDPLAGLRGMLDQLVAVFEDAGNTRVVFFCLLVGGLIALVQASGGVAGFIAAAQRRGWGATRRRAELLAWTLGMLVFVESSITCLIVGAVSRPLFDQLRLPREKLAYYCDATSAPVCMAIPLNGWGAYVLGLLAAGGVAAGGAVPLLAEALLYNFYSWLTILAALGLALTGRRFGPMRRAEERAEATGALVALGARPLVAEGVVDLPPVRPGEARARDLVAPLAVMVAGIFAGLWITGEGDLMQGSGSTAVLWAVCAAIAAAVLLYRLPRGGRPLLTLSESTDLILKGCAGLVGVTVLIVLAFALGQVSRALDIGGYIAGLFGPGAPLWWIPGSLFVVGAALSFTLGSSWTAFAILIPIALPLASALGLPPALMLGAVLSAGVFGDHASPLSDTTIISAMSAACDLVDHTNTQLPYALAVAGVSLAGYVAAGLML